MNIKHIIFILTILQIGCQAQKDYHFDKIVFSIHECKLSKDSSDTLFTDCPKFAFMMEQGRGLVSQSLNGTSKHNFYSFNAKPDDWESLVKIIDSLELDKGNIDYGSYNEFLEIDLLLFKNDSLKFHISHIDTLKLERLYMFIKSICKTNKLDNIKDTAFVNIEKYIHLPPKPANRNEVARFK